MLLFVCGHFLGCGQSFAQNDPAPDSITIEVDSTHIHAGEKTKITVTAHYKDGSSKDVSAASHGTKYFRVSIPGMHLMEIDEDGTILALDNGSNENKPEKAWFLILHKGLKKIAFINISPESNFRIEPPKKPD